MTMVSTNNSLSGLQEPVQQLRTEYKQIINRLPEVLSTEQAEEVLQYLLTLSIVYACICSHNKQFAVTRFLMLCNCSAYVAWHTGASRTPQSF